MSFAQFSSNHNLITHTNHNFHTNSACGFGQHHVHTQPGCHPNNGCNHNHHTSNCCANSYGQSSCLGNFNNNVGCSHHGHNCFRRMRPADAERLYLHISRQCAFDRDRLQMAKTFLRNAHLSSAQVRRFTSLFSFDNAKLSFAKFAYRRTCDTHNYYVVTDAFAFFSTKRKLQEFIAGINP